MSVLHLDQLFNPRSVVLIGASNQTRTVGQVILNNLRASPFHGELYAVNPKYREIAGMSCFATVEELPVAPELAVICTPPPTLPGLLTALGERGTRACVIITAMSHGDTGAATLGAELLQIARRHGMRILGPNGVGLLVPGIGLNASFAHTDGAPGQLAFISQSGALCTSVLDWAKTRGIGFSHFVSLGDALDVDFGDLIDYLGNLRETQALLLYIESIMAARKFLSAARAVARHKPIVLIKAGRMAEGARAAASHTGAITGSDRVFDAAVRRAGVLRVDTIDELFEAVETLAYAQRRIPGDRLLIITNGGGIGVLAADALAAAEGQLAPLATTTVAELDRVLPANWSRANPIDIIGDADANRYAQALEIVAKDRGFDAILVMLVPTALVDNTEVAGAVSRIAATLHKPVFAVWMGGNAVTAGRELLAAAHIPNFETPSSAIRAFMQLVHYERNQQTLMQTPDALPQTFTPRRDQARAIIRNALGNGETLLSEPAAKSLLAAYEIPVVTTQIATCFAEAEACATAIGYPVAAKILAKGVTHKSDIGGVMLDIHDAAELRVALTRMAKNLACHQPAAELQGFTIQQMARRPGAYELLLGVTTDRVFGPAVVFGQGGTAVEVIHDTAVALPPLNMRLADELIEHTQIARLLHGFRDRPPAALETLKFTLVKLSQLVVDHPEIHELDINPLLCDSNGVIALDARIVLAAGGTRLAIRPYPNDLEEIVTLPSGKRILFRPIRPEDEPAHRRFLERCAPEDLRFRFFRATNKFTHEFLAGVTQIDYDREMAFIAVDMDPGAERETLAVARSVADADNVSAEFAILVRSDLKGLGLGRRLMEKLITYQCERGTQMLCGQVLIHNNTMLALCRELCFEVNTIAVDEIVDVKYPLRAAVAPR